MRRKLIRALRKNAIALLPFVHVCAAIFPFHTTPPDIDVLMLRARISFYHQFHSLSLTQRETTTAKMLNNSWMWCDVWYTLLLSHRTLRPQPVPFAMNKNRQFGSKLKIDMHIVFFVRISKKWWNADYVDGRVGNREKSSASGITYRRVFCSSNSLVVPVVVGRYGVRRPTEHTNLFIAWMTRIQYVQLALSQQSSFSLPLQTHSIAVSKNCAPSLSLTHSASRITCNF